jgi:hypothetical protein
MVNHLVQLLELKESPIHALRYWVTFFTIQGAKVLQKVQGYSTKQIDGPRTAQEL